MKRKKIRQLVALIYTIIFTILPTFSVMAQVAEDKHTDVITIEAFGSESEIALFSIESFQFGPGGRHDLNFNDHNTTYTVKFQLTQKTRVQLWTKDWKTYSAKDYAPGVDHYINCPSSVYHVTFYLDNNKYVFGNVIK